MTFPQARWPTDTSPTRASDQELDMRRTLFSGKALGPVANVDEVIGSLSRQSCRS